MPLIDGTPPIKLTALESLERFLLPLIRLGTVGRGVPLIDKDLKSSSEMESSSTSRPARGLSAKDRQRLELAAEAVIESARLSGNSTGINWRRLPTISISESYATEYPGLTNQEIALHETMDEVERSVVQHQLDLDRIDNTELQGTIEDVLNDILDLMVPNARASSSEDESDSDSTGSHDSDDGSDSDALHVRRAHHRPHHEAEHANYFNSSRGSSSHIQGPHLRPISEPADKHVPAPTIDNDIVQEPQSRNAIHDVKARGTPEKDTNCCSTM